MPTLQAFIKIIERLKPKLCRLSKQHTSSEKDHNLEEFLAKEYILPSIGLRNGHVVHFSPVKQSRARVPQPVSTGLASEYTKTMPQKMYAVTRNSQKKLKRRDEKIEDQKEQIAMQLQTIQQYGRIESQILDKNSIQ